MAESTAVDEINWLYPDLISEEGLKYLLRKCFIRYTSAQLESLHKDELVELYNHYILPLPQRKYRNNRRGREMTKRQILLDKKLKRLNLNDSGDHSAAKKVKTEDPSSSVVNHFNVSSTSRLKPPPSLVNSEKKVVKLNSSTYLKSTASGSDGIVIKTWNKKVDENSTEVSSSETQTNSTTRQADKHSQLKRSPSSCENENNTQDLPKDVSPSPAKKIAKITWP